MIAFYPDGTEKIFKLLSSDPKNYKDAANEAIRRILEGFHGQPLDRESPLDLQDIGELAKKCRVFNQLIGSESLRMGTTVATNALLERQGARTALFITKGFKVIEFSRSEDHTTN